MDARAFTRCHLSGALVAWVTPLGSMLPIYVMVVWVLAEEARFGISND